MKELDVDKILKAMDSPKVGENALNIMDMLGEVNNVLGELQKTSRMLDTMGLKPLLVRAAGLKLGVDAETPLKGETAVQPTTEAHEQIYKQLNKLSPEEIAVIPQAIAALQEQNNGESEPESEEDDSE